MQQVMLTTECTWGSMISLDDHRTGRVVFLHPSWPDLLLLCIRLLSLSRRLPAGATIGSLFLSLVPVASSLRLT